MSYGLVLVFDGVSEAQYWSVNEKLGVTSGSKQGYPPGMLVHAGGPTPTGWVVSEIWDSKQSHETFMATRLGAALQASGVPAPAQVIETELVNFETFG